MLENSIWEKIDKQNLEKININIQDISQRMAAQRNKTSRRWVFVLVETTEDTSLSASLQKEPKVRFCIWKFKRQSAYTESKGYIEMLSPVKVSGIKKILNNLVIAEAAKRKREDIIRDLSVQREEEIGPFFYGEREIKRGGRPRKPKTQNDFALRGSYVFFAHSIKMIADWNKTFLSQGN